MTLQEIVFALERFWSERGCLIHQPWDAEVGAGTMHPETFFRVLGPEPWKVGYVQPSRRPADGRYGENPNRLYKHEQFQVILKPPPADIQDLYLASLEAIGIDPAGARRALRGGQLGVADARGLGDRLAGAARRPGDHAVHLLPAGGRDRPRADLRARSPTASSASRMYLQDVEDVYRPALVEGHPLPRRAPRGGVPALALLLRAGRRGAAPAALRERARRGLAARSRRAGGRAYLPAYDWTPEELARLQRARRARGHLGDRAGGDDPEDPQARVRRREGLRGRGGPGRGRRRRRPAVAELLLEIGFEEMPAPWLPGLAEQLRARFLEAAAREFLEAKDAARPAARRAAWCCGPTCRRASPTARSRSGARRSRSRRTRRGSGRARPRASRRRTRVAVDGPGRRAPRTRRSRASSTCSTCGRWPGARRPRCCPASLAGVLRALAFPKRMSWDAWLDDGRGAFPFGRPDSLARLRCSTGTSCRSPSTRSRAGRGARSSWRAVGRPAATASCRRARAGARSRSGRSRSSSGRCGSGS